jgi:hypothetical protein
MLILLRIILIIICISAISCEKFKDERDVYIGKYKVTETINCYGPCGTCSSTKDTTIVVGYGLTDTSISVLGRDVTLDESGEYFAYHYGLIFQNDSIFSTYMNGGLGCGQYESYVGVKISDKP